MNGGIGTLELAARQVAQDAILQAPAALLARNDDSALAAMQLSSEHRLAGQANQWPVQPEVQAQISQHAQTHLQGFWNRTREIAAHPRR